MRFLIGTDEAGYGPNLGPLVIAGTRWQQPIEGDLYQQLRGAVTSDPGERSDRVLIADSKAVLANSCGFAELESTVYALAQLVRQTPIGSFRHLVETLVSGPGWPELASLPCLLLEQLPRFRTATKEAVEQKVTQLRRELNTCHVVLDGVDVRLVFPDRFNRELVRWENKATLLSMETLELIGRLQDGTSGEVEVVCDKHGGRSRYAALIQNALTDQWVEVGIESRSRSCYRFKDPDRRVSIQFLAGGDRSSLAVAASSMAAKYLRERCMDAWNEFWQREVTDLTPTKGYPVDARRFMADIALAQRKLQVDRERIWRCR